MKESNQVRKLLIASAVIVLGIPAIAGATPNISKVEENAVRVSYADLNLSNEAGLVKLYARLQSASRAVCGPRFLDEAGSLEQLSQNKACYRNALSKAVAKFDNARLDRIHAG
jgi:UrcA family protein